MRKSHEAVSETGRALGAEAHERGVRLSDDEKSALAHWSRWGSDGYPVRKMGRWWVVEHSLMSTSGMFKTKGEAFDAWETIIAKLVAMSGLEAYDRAVAELAVV